MTEHEVATLVTRTVRTRSLGLSSPGLESPGDTRTAITSAVTFQHVSVGYGDRLALSDVSLSIRPGSLVAVIGPNGAGKSTLLKLMAGLMQPWSGRVTILGGTPGAAASRIAYLPQAEAVDWQFPVTVGEVALMGRYARTGFLRDPGPADGERAARALEQVGMADAAHRQIGALSGGQRRRVFLARALAGDPDIYLLDEPVAGVDARTQDDLMTVLEGEAGKGKTVIATTHDLLAAAQQFHEAAFINGRLIAQGPANRVLDQSLLTQTYGDHVLILGGEGGRVILDDAHDHDDAPQSERRHQAGER